MMFQVIQHARHNAAGSAGRRGNDDSAAGIFFADGQRIRRQQSRARQVGPLGGRFFIKRIRFAGQTQPAGQNVFMFQTVLNGPLHLIPDAGQILPDFFAFIIKNDCPDRPALLFRPGNDIRKRFISIDFFSRRFAFFAQSAAAHAVNRPNVRGILIRVKRFKFHGVGVKRQNGIFLPDNLRFVFAQNVQNRLIGKVAFSRGGQTAVQSHAVRTSLRIFFKKTLSGPARRHCMAAGRPHADSVKFFQRLHRLSSCKTFQTSLTGYS